tara:strand:+ start:79849 stop:80493 length:645 start_codon:yes stop_codon:yes gene_type:complete
MNKKTIVFSLLLIGCITISCNSTKVFKEKWTKKEAPAMFKARFETTQGNFDIVAQREWSPKGVDRLYQLITNDFYTNIALYRVVPDFVAQFGIHNDSVVNTSWRAHKVPDEPVVAKNLEGTIAFARGGKETRTTQLFINLKNNSPRLDTLFNNGVTGFPVVAKVTNGMDVVKKFYDVYGGAPGQKQGLIHKGGNNYLKQNFPKLDYITKAYLIK